MAVVGLVSMAATEVVAARLDDPPPGTRIEVKPSDFDGSLLVADDSANVIWRVSRQR